MLRAHRDVHELQSRNPAGQPALERVGVNITIGVHSMSRAGGTEINVFQVARGLVQRGHTLDLVAARDGELAAGVPHLLPQRGSSSDLRFRPGQRAARPAAHDAGNGDGREEEARRRLPESLWRKSCGRRQLADFRGHRSCAISTSAAMLGRGRSRTSTCGGSSPCPSFFGASGWNWGSTPTGSTWSTTGCRATTTRWVASRSGPAARARLGLAQDGFVALVLRTSRPGEGH